MSKNQIAASVVAVFALVGSAHAQSPVPIFIKHPELVTETSKSADDIAAYVKKKGSKELTVVTDESAAKLTLEVLSNGRNMAAGTSTTTPAFGSAITTHTEGFTTVLKLCIPAKEHCEEFSASSAYNLAQFEAADKVRKFAKDNAVALLR